MGSARSATNVAVALLLSDLILTKLVMPLVRVAETRRAPGVRKLKKEALVVDCEADELSYLYILNDRGMVGMSISCLLRHGRGKWGPYVPANT